MYISHYSVLRFFGDNFFITSYFELTLTWYVSSFLSTSRGRNFSWFRQIHRDFQKTPIVKVARLRQRRVRVYAWSCQYYLNSTMGVNGYYLFLSNWTENLTVKSTVHVCILQFKAYTVPLTARLYMDIWDPHDVVEGQTRGTYGQQDGSHAWGVQPRPSPLLVIP